MAKRPRKITPGGSRLSFDPLVQTEPGDDPDPWIRQILSTYLAEIEQRIGTRLARSSGRVRRPLGCGAFGCVFLLDDGRVLKITHDDAEGAYSMFMRSMQQEDLKFGDIPVITVTARVDDVFRIPMRKNVDGNLQTVYGIVREQVGPSDEQIPETFRQAASIYTDGWDVFCSTLEGAVDPRRFLGLQMARIGLRRMQDERGYGRRIGGFLRLCWDRGMPLMDVHANNLARRIEKGFSPHARRGQILLFDYGGSESYDTGTQRCRFRRMSDYEAEVQTL